MGEEEDSKPRTEFTKENRLVFSWGEALHELKDHPHFIKVKQMIDGVIKSLQDSIDSGAPEDYPEIDYNQVIAARVNQVKGVKTLRDLIDQYQNYYLKFRDQAQEDEEDAYTRPVNGPAVTRRKPKSRK